jgi:hypothetical protein
MYIVYKKHTDDEKPTAVGTYRTRSEAVNVVIKLVDELRNTPQPSKTQTFGGVMTVHFDTWGVSFWIVKGKEEKKGDWHA